MKAWSIAKETELITAAIILDIAFLLIVVVPYRCRRPNQAVTVMVCAPTRRCAPCLKPE